MAHRLVEAEFGRFARIAEAVEVDMPDLDWPRPICLDEREARRGDILRRLAGARTPRRDERAGQMALAGADLTREQDGVARLRRIGNERAEPCRGGRVGQVYGPVSGHRRDFSAVPAGRKPWRPVPAR